MCFNEFILFYFIFLLWSVLLPYRLSPGSMQLHSLISLVPSSTRFVHLQPVLLSLWQSGMHLLSKYNFNSTPWLDHSYEVSFQPEIAGGRFLAFQNCHSPHPPCDAPLKECILPCKFLGKGCLFSPGAAGSHKVQTNAFFFLFIMVTHCVWLLSRNQ